MSAVSAKSPDNPVSPPAHVASHSQDDIYTTDDQDDHQSFAEYSDSDDDASDDDEPIDYHEATHPLYHPDEHQYEDEHGFTVHVRTDDEYSDDTTDSEYVAEKRRQSQMIAPESMQAVAQDSDSESEYEDKIGAVYQPGSDSDSEYEDKIGAVFKDDIKWDKSEGSVSQRSESRADEHIDSLRSTDVSDSDSEDDLNLVQSVSKDYHRQTARNSLISSSTEHKVEPMDELQESEPSDSEEETKDKVAEIVPPPRRQPSVRKSGLVRRTSKRIIGPIDDQLVNRLSTYLESPAAPKEEEKESTKENDVTADPVAEPQSKSDSMYLDLELSDHDQFSFANIAAHMKSEQQEQQETASTKDIVHEDRQDPDEPHKVSVDRTTESSYVEGTQYASDFDSVCSAETSATTPKSEMPSLDTDEKSMTAHAEVYNVEDINIIRTTSPNGFVDEYLSEVEDVAPPLPPKEEAKAADTHKVSNRFSTQSLSGMNDISLDQPAEAAVAVLDNQSAQPERYSLASYNNPTRLSKTLPPIDTNIGASKASMENASPKSTNILQNAFRLQSPVTFGNPFKRTPPSPVTSSPRTSISTPQTRPSQAYSARHSKRMSKQLTLPLKGTSSSVDELLLARLEQQNSELRSDPKNRVLQNLQREAVRRSVEQLKQEKLSMSSDGDKGDYDWEFWALCLSNFQHITRSQSRVLATNIQHGIPPSLRGMIWQMFSKSKDPVLENQYRDLLSRDSPYDKMIQRDLARTFPDHPYFKDPEGQGQIGLFNVVKAYSIYDQDVGYCQGIAFIVGALLLNYGLRGHYTPDMEGLQLHLFQYERLLGEQLPHIYNHLQRKGISSTMYASQWFMTLFAYKFPLEVVFRIYDILLSEGVESIIRFAIALLRKNEKTILSLEFEALLHFLKNDLFTEYETQQLVEDACAVHISPRRIEQLTKEHRTLMSKAQMEKDATEELYKSNAEITATIQSLEQKLSSMFAEHDDVLAQLDNSKKQLNFLTNENEQMRQHVASLKETVELLPGEVEALSRDEFEVLCTENATLIEKNCTLEDQLSTAEAVLIDMKIKYAESENETDSLRRQLNGMRKIMAV
ncbi:hypothetical protein NQZ79_g4142 [Umbelopsis isabellina]|nr:hypothetical protein NQZ79_g4142 [Umbelopsis isabellina]